MITNQEITPVGRTVKTHGIKGELSVSFDKVPFDEDDIKFFVFDVDGIFVPFFIEDYRFKTDFTAIYKFEGIDSEEQARELNNKTIYIHNDFLINLVDDEPMDIYSFIGFSITDNSLGDLGKITEIDDSTQNVLFIVNNKKDELLVPASDYLITDIDEENKIIYMDLPEGLVNMDLAEDEE
jgi:16S rRNA processing protein RimM